MNINLFLLLLFVASALQAEHCFRYDQCECRFKTITCRNADLPQLPLFFSYSSATTITLTNINIKAVNISTKYTQLKVLKIHQTPLEVARFKQFDFSTLKHVDLDDNQIEKLVTESEKLPESLEIFSARNNRLSSLGTDADFTKFHKLTHLQLSGNSFQHINSGRLPDSLMLLDLSHNALTWLASGFQSLESLQVLLVADNDIETVKEDELPPKLAEFDVSHNQITSIDLLRLNRNLALNMIGNSINCSCSFVKDFQTAVDDNELRANCEPYCVTCEASSVINNLTSKMHNLDVLCPGSKPGQSPTVLVIAASVCVFILILAAVIYNRESMSGRVARLENEEDGIPPLDHMSTSNEHLVPDDDYVTFRHLQMAGNQRLAPTVEYTRNVDGPIYSQVPRVQPRAVLVF